ncbi:hypothetical protein PENSTE_c001G06158 [Penicillium steckii]|uniref:Uncharacterized protein n=1 Tax=Penicillium steckii TaxID=303698 RepID=A0A1V6U051_9EURO|nr:hypothetical protein PENSTE_c001G06158 [Penicillium steckii]
MSLAITKASRLKPEIRLAQAVSEFEADLSTEQKATFRTNRSKTISSPPTSQDVMRLTAEIDRGTGNGNRCLGPRLTNVLQAVQKFAALGDIIIGGSQNLVACGIWTIVRTSLLLMTTFSSYLEKLSLLFMEVGLYAPRYERMALLYPKSRDLQSSLSEYFIVIVHMCHDVLNFAKKSNLRKLSATLFDSNLEKYHSDLKSLGLSIRDEVEVLMAETIHDEAQANSHLRDISAKFFGFASNHKRLQARQRILEFCSSYDPTTVWKQVRKSGNASSFQKTPEYQFWKAQDISSTLIFTGKLGSGKSVLLANIVDDLHIQDIKPNTAVVSFFFCRYDIPETLKTQTIVGSILRQILSQIPDIEKSAKLLDQSENLERSERFLALASSAIPESTKVFAVIDGVDEIDEAERESLLTVLLAFQKTFSLSICLSYRQDTNDPMKVDSRQLLRVRTSPIPDNTADIQNFIENEMRKRVQTNKLIVGELELLLEIKQALVGGSHGMFLWVVLQMDALCAMQTDKAIRDALKDLPEGLSETFRRILSTAAKADSSYQRSILELMIAAQRPLSLEEMREALSVIPGDTTWDPENIINDIHRVLACCGSLIFIDEEQLTISFVHHSVKQYLLEDFEDSAKKPISAGDGHSRMTEIIVTYLNYTAFDREISKHVLPEIRTVDALSGIFRSNLSQSSMDGMTSLALRIFGENTNSDFNMAKTLAEARRKRPRGQNQFLFREYAMSFWDQHVFASPPLGHETRNLFQKLQHKMVLNPDAVAQRIKQFFTYAVSGGQIGTVESLIKFVELDLGEIQYPHGRTALHMAVMCGSTGIPILLLSKKGRQIDWLSRDEFGKTALEIAYDKEMFSLCNVLLSLTNDDYVKGLFDAGNLSGLQTHLLTSATVKLPPESFESSTTHNGALVREVAEERCELEATVDGLDCYQKEVNQVEEEHSSQINVDYFRERAPRGEQFDFSMVPATVKPPAVVFRSSNKPLLEHNGALVREVAKERCDLEAPADALNFYRKETNRVDEEHSSRMSVDDYFRERAPCGENFDFAMIPVTVEPSTEIIKPSNRHNIALAREITQEICELEAPFDGLGRYHKDDQQANVEQKSDLWKTRLVNVYLMELSSRETFPQAHPGVAFSGPFDSSPPIDISDSEFREIHYLRSYHKSLNMCFGFSNYMNLGPKKPAVPRRKDYGDNEEKFLCDHEAYQKSRAQYEDEKNRMKRRREHMRSSQAQLGAGMMAAGGGGC